MEGASRNPSARAARPRALRARVRPAALLVGLGLGLVAACLAGAAMGAYEVPPIEVVGSVLHRLGIELGPVPAGVGESVLWDIRFPRVALAVLVGASLGCAGAAMQGKLVERLKKNAGLSFEVES